MGASAIIKKREPFAFIQKNVGHRQREGGKSVMKTDKKIAQRLVALIAPIVAAPAWSQAPAVAATLVSSEATFQFDNFSHTAYSVGAATNTNTLTLTTGPASLTTATASAFGYFVPGMAGTFSSSAASGQGSSYLGVAQSLAQVVGNFLVGPGESFGFNFRASLALASSVSAPQSERANAAGRIAFWLFGSANGGPPSLLDSFSAFGQVAAGGNNFLGLQSSGNIRYRGGANMYGTATESLASANFQGSYQRDFNSATQLTLVEVQEIEANVAVPEPSVPLALPLSIFFLCVGWKARKKTAILGKLKP